MSLQHDHANALLMSSLARRGGDEVGAELWWHEAERIGLALDAQDARNGSVQGGETVAPADCSVELSQTVAPDSRTLHQQP